MNLCLKHTRASKHRLNQAHHPQVVCKPACAMMRPGRASPENRVGNTGQRFSCHTPRHGPDTPAGDGFEEVRQARCRRNYPRAARGVDGQLRWPICGRAPRRPADPGIALPRLRPMQDRQAPRARSPVNSGKAPCGGDKDQDSHTRGLHFANFQVNPSLHNVNPCSWGETPEGVFQEALRARIRSICSASS